MKKWFSRKLLLGTVIGPAIIMYMQSKGIAPEIILAVAKLLGISVASIGGVDAFMAYKGTKTE